MEMKRLIVHFIPPLDNDWADEPVILIEGVYFPRTGFILDYVSEEGTEYYSFYQREEDIYRRFGKDGCSSSIEWVDPKEPQSEWKLNIPGKPMKIAGYRDGWLRIKPIEDEEKRNERD